MGAEFFIVAQVVGILFVSMLELVKLYGDFKCLMGESIPASLYMRIM